MSLNKEIMATTAVGKATELIYNLQDMGAELGDDEKAVIKLMMMQLADRAFQLGTFESEDNSEPSTSAVYMNESFPLADHPLAYAIQGFVKASLYPEDPDEGRSKKPCYYLRSDWHTIKQGLAQFGIVLTPEQEDALREFASEYASLADAEADAAEDALLIQEEMK